MTFHPITVDEAWHARLRARLLERVTLRVRLARAEARVAELEAERAQAAPVLAAAEQVVYSGKPLLLVVTALHEAYDTWRAARDGVAEPCPACGGELYDQIVRDPVTRRPICPHCRADVSATDDDDEDADDEESGSPRAGEPLT